jgi:hypothetical protein
LWETKPRRRLLSGLASLWRSVCAQGAMIFPIIPQAPVKIGGSYHVDWQLVVVLAVIFGFKFNALQASK